MGIRSHRRNHFVNTISYHRQCYEVDKVGFFFFSRWEISADFMKGKMAQLEEQRFKVVGGLDGFEHCSLQVVLEKAAAEFLG